MGAEGPRLSEADPGRNSRIQPLKVPKLSHCWGVPVPFAWPRGILVPHCWRPEGEALSLEGVGLR